VRAVGWVASVCLTAYVPAEIIVSVPSPFELKTSFSYLS